MQISQNSKEKSKIFISTPVNALVEGIYQQNIPVSEILHHGDFGLGTFNDLDGEMVILDGKIYQADSTGKVSEMDSKILTPFACTTFFKPVCFEEYKGRLNYSDFLKWIESLMPSPNIFYAFKIKGNFEFVRTRSVPKQENYRPLVEVAKDQPEFRYQNVNGTLAGFHTPSFMSSLNVPGLHLHFLSEDLSKGGHLLECITKEITAEIQFLYSLELSLPVNLDYLFWDFRRDIVKDLNKAEK